MKKVIIWVDADPQCVPAVIVDANTRVIVVNNVEDFKDAVRDIAYDEEIIYMSFDGEVSTQCMLWFTEYYQDHYEAIGDFFPIFGSHSKDPQKIEEVLTKYNKFVNYWNNGNC